jgi:hypothetical protein
MYFRGDKPLFFATDLTNFLGCRHLTAVERVAAHKLAKRPYYDDPMLEILRERGLEHEQAYVHSLRAKGERVVEIDKQSPNAFGDTVRAMQEGADVIVQARLEHGSWAGWADVLLRVDGDGRRDRGGDTNLSRRSSRRRRAERRSSSSACTPSCWRSSRALHQPSFGSSCRNRTLSQSATGSTSFERTSV